MTYELEFKVSALMEWRKLDESVRHQFKKHEGSGFQVAKDDRLSGKSERQRNQLD